MVSSDQGQRINYRTCLQKIYKDKGGKWGEIDYFDREDLLLVAEVARAAASAAYANS